MGPFYVGTIVLFGQQGLRGQRMLDINGVGQGDHAAVLGAEFGPDPERTLWNGDDDGARREQTPEMVLEEKQFQEQVYAAVMKLPEKQAKRIYARYYLGMTVNKIAEVEGVDPSRVRDSIRRGLKQLVKYF